MSSVDKFIGILVFLSYLYHRHIDKHTVRLVILDSGNYKIFFNCEKSNCNFSMQQLQLHLYK